MYKPIKSLGQNFLTDKSIVRKMVDALELKNDDFVIEIGPGHGVLTQELAELLNYPESKIYAIDIDERFSTKLDDMFVTRDNVIIINEDILKWLPNFESDRPFKILGSLPYYITSPILHETIKMKVQPEICVLLVQKEVAHKIAAQAPDSSYLSVFAQTFYNVEYIGTVERKRFIPEPKVDGGIIKLKKIPGVSMDHETLHKYEGFLHRAFASPRKMLNKPFSKEELALVGIDGNKRPQNLSAPEWLNFFYRISGK